MKPAISHESLMMPSDWDVTGFDPNDPLSQSLPESILFSALPKQRNSYSPAPNSVNFLQVPDKNVFLFPHSQIDRRGGTCSQNAIRGSSSMIDLSASAPAAIFRQNLAETGLMSQHSCEHLAFSSQARNSPLTWLSLSPRTSPQNSPSQSSTSSSSWSFSTFSPPFSPDNLQLNMAHEASPPSYAHLCLPNPPSSPLLISPLSTPHCSPYSSPSGSQTQICIRSVGTEC